MTSPWTSELKELVSKLWSNHSASQIAEKLPGDFTRNSVVGLLHRMGLSMSDKTVIHPLTRDVVERGPRKPRVPTPTKTTTSVNVRSIKIARDKPKPEVFVCQDAADIVPLRLELKALALDNCRWPYNAFPDETGEGSFRFCGHVCLKSQSYCIPHTILGRGTGTASERAAAWVSKRAEAAV